MQKKIILAIQIIVLLTSCSQNKTELKNAEIFIKTYLNYFESREAKKCYDMLSENFKNNFRNKYKDDYFEYFDSESVRAENKYSNFEIIEKYFKSNSFYFKVKYLEQNLDAKGFVLITYKVIKINNVFKIDDEEKVALGEIKD